MIGYLLSILIFSQINSQLYIGSNYFDKKSAVKYPNTNEDFCKNFFPIISSRFGAIIFSIELMIFSTPALFLLALCAIFVVNQLFLFLIIGFIISKSILAIVNLVFEKNLKI